MPESAPRVPRSGRLPFDRLTWTRWRAAIGTFAGSDVGSRAKVLFAALLLLLIGINGLNVVNSYVGRDFMTAIEARSMPRFLSMALLYLAVFALSTLAAVIYRFTEQRLGLLWREWLTRRIVGRYLQGDNYYWLRDYPEVANPDQRMADDVRSFTASTLSLALVLLNASFTIIAFAGVMWTISPWLFAAAAGYAALGSLLTIVFGRPLLWLSYDQADREASLRADLVHVRENAEFIATLHREGRIGARLSRRVDDLVSNLKRIIAVNRNLDFFTTGYNYLIQIIPILIVAPLFIQGRVEFGVISQAAMAFATLVGAFSLIITQFQQISAYAVVLARLGALVESIDASEARAGSGIAIDDGAAVLAWQGLTLRSPHDGAELVRSLDLAVAPGTRLLVTGPSEAARFALFRATAGLWRAGEGRIARPPRDALAFVSERPYLPPGTIREAIVRFGHDDEADDARVAEALRAVEMHEAVERAGGLETELDWDDAFSLAEQQRLVIARVLLAAPSFAVLDRPATALGAEGAAQMLARLAERAVTAVTLAPDETLATLHDRVLELAEDGGWSQHPAREESRTA